MAEVTVAVPDRCAIVAQGPIDRDDGRVGFPFREETTTPAPACVRSSARRYG